MILCPWSFVIATATRKAWEEISGEPRSKIVRFGMCLVYLICRCSLDSSPHCDVSVQYATLVVVLFLVCSNC